MRPVCSGVRGAMTGEESGSIAAVGRTFRSAQTQTGADGTTATTSTVRRMMGGATGVRRTHAEECSSSANEVTRPAILGAPGATTGREFGLTAVAEPTSRSVEEVAVEIPVGAGNLEAVAARR